MVENNTSNFIMCGNPNSSWNEYSLVSNDKMNLEDFGYASYSERKVYSFDFVSLEMINPFNDVNISLYCLFTILLRVSLVLIYIYWPKSGLHQESLSSIFSTGNMNKPVSNKKINDDYECFDCIFTCASRAEMNLHSRLCLLGVTNFQFSEHHSQ